MSRLHWMPEIIWIGVTIGQWPLETWGGDIPGQAKAERWAAEDPDNRRIFSVAVPSDTVAYSVETVPAKIKMNQVHP